MFLSLKNIKRIFIYFNHFQIAFHFQLTINATMENLCHLSTFLKSILLRKIVKMFTQWFKENKIKFIIIKFCEIYLRKIYEIDNTKGIIYVLDKLGNFTIV